MTQIILLGIKSSRAHFSFGCDVLVFVVWFYDSTLSKIYYILELYRGNGKTLAFIFGNLKPSSVENVVISYFHIYQVDFIISICHFVSRFWKRRVIAGVLFAFCDLFHRNRAAGRSTSSFECKKQKTFSNVFCLVWWRIFLVRDVTAEVQWCDEARFYTDLLRDLHCNVLWCDFTTISYVITRR